MMFLFSLRMMADLGFYYAIAGCAAASFGSCWQLLQLIVLSMSYGIAGCLQKRSHSILLLCGISGMCLVLPVWNLADRLLFTPAVLYVFFLCWKNEFSLSWGRQADLFLLFLKVFVGFALAGLVVGQYSILASAGIPAALMQTASSVLLMRSLRHEPMVYEQKRYQVINLVSIAAVFLVSWLISTDVVRNGLGLLISLFYEHVAAPLIMGISMAAGYLVIGIIRIIGFLFDFLGIKGGDSNSNFVQELSFAPEEAVLLETGEGNEIVGKILLAIVILAVIVLLVLFFRWLSTRETGERWELAAEEKRREGEASSREPQAERVLSSAAQVRRYYRKFLRLYLERGAYLHRSYTSQDVERNAKNVFSNHEAMEQMRELYIKARYSQKVQKEDVVLAKQLYRQIRKGG
ncbi:MAG: hypothetical protein IJ468_05405 [Lachnospiraceae bacterium]|nr:hypothetical protein [Lachnospiraceae bacterium]